MRNYTKCEKMACPKCGSNGRNIVVNKLEDGKRGRGSTEHSLFEVYVQCKHCNHSSKPVTGNWFNTQLRHDAYAEWNSEDRSAMPKFKRKVDTFKFVVPQEQLKKYLSSVSHNPVATPEKVVAWVAKKFNLDNKVAEQHIAHC